jgi:nitronate monooxygenase
MARIIANEASSRLGIEHPIIQGPFGGGLSTVALAATVANLGGLGSFGAHSFAPDRIQAIADELRAHTDRPFALNLWVSDHDPGGDRIDERAFEQGWRVFEPYFRELGVPMPTPPERGHPRFEEQVDALLEARPPVFSFVFGIPSRPVLAECRRRGIATVGAATTVAEALALEAAGIDLVVATGMEAGGHRPSFLASAEDSLTGTFALVQLVSARVRIPVIAAGGIADGRGVRAAMMLGAQAAQIGTAFLACEESGTSDAHRAALRSPQAHDTTLTRTFTGRLARGLRNRWTRELAARAHELPPFPTTSWFASRLRPAAVEAGRTDLVSLWSGQIAPNLRHRTAAALMQSLVEDLAIDIPQHHPHLEVFPA